MNVPDWTKNKFIKIFFSAGIQLIFFSKQIATIKNIHSRNQFGEINEINVKQDEDFMNGLGEELVSNIASEYEYQYKEISGSVKLHIGDSWE